MEIWKRDDVRMGSHFNERELTENLSTTTFRYGYVMKELAHGPRSSKPTHEKTAPGPLQCTKMMAIGLNLLRMVRGRKRRANIQQAS